MDDEAAEQLRRRLYARGATAADVTRFREAEVVAKAPGPASTAGGPGPRTPRRRRAAAVLPVLLAALAVVLAVTQAVRGSDGRTIPAPTSPAPVATEVVALPLTTVDLPGSGGADAIAGLFRPGSIAGSRAADFGALTALRVAPQSSGIDLERSGSGWIQEKSLVSVRLPDVALAPGDLLVLTSVTDRPATVTWRFTAEPDRGTAARTVVLARSPRASVLGGAVRIRDRAVLGGLVLTVTGGAQARYRYAIHRYREPSPLGDDVSRVDLRCAVDVRDAETRCVRRS